MPPCPIQAHLRTDRPHVLQVALVPRHHLDRLHLTHILPMITFHIDHLEEVVEGVKGTRLGDVVDEEEGIGAEIRGGPEPAVFFLPGGIGEGEEVRFAVYIAGDGIGVLWQEGRFSACPCDKAGGCGLPMVGSYLRMIY